MENVRTGHPARGCADVRVKGDQPVGVWEQSVKGVFVYLMAQAPQPDGRGSLINHRRPKSLKRSFPEPDSHGQSKSRLRKVLLGLRSEQDSLFKG